MSSSTRPASASLPLLLSLTLPMLRGAAAAFQCQQPATTTTVARHLHHHQQQQRRRSAPVMRTGSVFERLGREFSTELMKTLSHEERPKIDWSFLDAVFLITCPKPDGSNPRLETALKSLNELGLGELCEVREFATDDQDRVRGCYNSHIAVLAEAQARFADRPTSEPLNVLVLEDNLSVSPRIAQPTLDAIREFLGGGHRVLCPGGRSPDMVHLAYIMYVPGLSVESLGKDGEGESWRNSILRLRCNADSVLGTTAYVISRSGLDSVMAEHRRTGYVDAIPNVMARLFPTSRYAAFPMPLHRAATVKSLVNGQLDTLRSALFQPQVYTWWERLLVKTGLSTNILFPALCATLVVGAFAGGSEALSALQAAARGEDVAIVLPVLSAAISFSCLAVIGYGLMLAPSPQPAMPAAPEPRPELETSGRS